MNITVNESTHKSMILALKLVQRSIGDTDVLFDASSPDEVVRINRATRALSKVRSLLTRLEKEEVK